MEKSIINSLLQENTTNHCKKSGFPGFRETPLSRAKLEQMSDKELLRMHQLYGYHITTNIYAAIGKLTNPTRFPVKDYLEPTDEKRTNILKKRFAKANKSSALIAMWMENMSLIQDEVFDRFFTEEEEDEN